MPTFIDESGDTGHQADSSPHFRLAAVWVPTPDNADSLRDAIRQLRQRLRLPTSYEFKFARTGSHPERREEFLQAAVRHGFRFAAVSLDKRPGGWQGADREGIHWACAADLAATLRPIYLEEEKTRAKGGGHGRPLGELIVCG